MKRVRVTRDGIVYRFLYQAVRLRAQELWEMEGVYHQLFTLFMEHVGLGSGA